MFSPKVNSLREIIARNYLSISLKELERQNLNFIKCDHLIKFKQVMDYLYPEGACPDLGRKYV